MTVASLHEVPSRTPRDEVVEDGGAAVVLVIAIAALVGAQAPRAQLQGAVQEAASRHVDIAEAAAEAPTAGQELQVHIHFEPTSFVCSFSLPARRHALWMLTVK